MCLLALFTLACRKANPFDVPIEPKQLKFQSYNFSQAFYEKKIPLVKLRQEYSLFFDANTPDMVYQNKQNNAEEQAFYHESKRVFGNYKQIDADLARLFSRVKHYFPVFKEPKVYYLIGGVDAQMPIIYQNNLLIISVDNFLGDSLSLYKDQPDYLRQNFKSERLLPQAASAIAQYIISSYPHKNTFLDQMLVYGKQMLLVDAFLPHSADHIKIGYTTAELNWCEAQQADVYNYFISNDLLFKTDVDLYRRFLAPSPFSKFYLDIDKQSPGRVGVWLGWQIARAFYNRHPSLMAVLEAKDAVDFLNGSGYRPKKR